MIILILVSLTTFNIKSSTLADQSISNNSRSTPQIAFVSDRDGWSTDDIYVMNPDGSNMQNLTNHRAEDMSPSWSPDGTKILFKRYAPGDSYSYIFTMNADGTELTQVLESHNEHAWFPVWSPDGTKIAYQLFSGEVNFQNFSIWVMDADGSNHIKLTNHPGDDTHPSWSPDGTRIIFTRNWNGDSEIFIINLNGTGETNLTNDPAQDYDPDFSPDGLKIVFVSDRVKPSGIWMMNSDGSDSKLLYLMEKDMGNYDSNPDWSADGSRIIFHSWRHHKWELFVIDARGACQSQLTEVSVYTSFQGDRDAVWQPIITDLPPPPFCVFQPINIKLVSSP